MVQHEMPRKDTITSGQSFNSLECFLLPVKLILPSCLTKQLMNVVINPAICKSTTWKPGLPEMLENKLGLSVNNWEFVSAKDV